MENFLVEWEPRGGGRWDEGKKDKEKGEQTKICKYYNSVNIYSLAL